MTAASETVIGPPARPGPVQWLRKNLFSSWFNGLLTVISLAVIFFALRGVLSWAVYSANWSPVVESLRLFAVGTYPVEQLGRIWFILYMASFLLGVSAGRWRGTVLTFAMGLGVAFLILGLLPISLEYLPLATRLRLAMTPVMVVLGFAVGWKLPIPGRVIAIAWAVSFVLTMILLGGFRNVAVLPRVETGQWGGLLLTFLLALVGIVASFPIGVALALGRQSRLPVVKVLCVGFIEVVRGVPLVTILFMASIILPLFLPEGIRIDRVLRAMIGMTLFAAAYMAENVRGGLQSIPAGQYEAAKAVGLTGFQTTALIVLPQALRVVIPAIVGQFIALFMDTTLAIIVGLLELLAVGKAVLQSNPEWLLLDMEVYLFVAAVFWIFTYSMSFASRRVERAVGLGQR
jgi:general L-amino acid transport system permease protein